ncbi:helix-turn-helix domain-containing protein, partial [Xenorhabdus japonica]
MKMTLTDAQKEALELMHDTTRDGRVRDRIKAVFLMTKWLHRQGFSDKKPMGTPHKFDADKQQQFI